MRRLLLTLLVAVCLSPLLAACGRTNTDEFSPQAVAAAAKEAGTVNGLCPIMKKPVIVGDTAEYKGEKFGFCCPGCSTQFLKDPERYVKAMQAEAVRYGYKQK
jgi:YHS domain-containing protein